MPEIAVSFLNHQVADKAKQLAKDLQLDFLGDPYTEAAAHYDFLLVLTPSHLGIIKPGDKHPPFFIDFLSGPLAYRAEKASLRKETVGRAMGCHPRENPVIIDTTAGLGRDSYILATLGFQPIMLERSALLYVLLKDAMQRAAASPQTAAVIERMHLIQADAIDWLNHRAYPRQPDIIYLDPMFPERKKSASVKKEMVILQEILGKDEDCARLLQTALQHAKKRVVVKRPRTAANIGDLAPNFEITGKSSRFDIYLV